MRFLLILLSVLAAACGGGGGGPAAPGSGIAGTVPSDGETEAATDSAVAITFTVAADLDTVTGSTVRLVRAADDTPVGAQLLKQGFNRTTVRLMPLAPLLENAHYRLIVSGSIRADSGGSTLGADREVCFITRSATPTIRPDQIVDLGDALNDPRFEARWVRTTQGRVFVFGGFTNDQTATSSIEEWRPNQRRFVRAGNMLVARAQHTVTLLNSGAVLVAGGVSTAGGPPLKSTEYATPGGGASPGPDLRVARRYHAASRHLGGASVMVSGGFGGNGEPLDSVEYLDGLNWVFANGLLGKPTARHLQFDFDFDKVYFSAGNLLAMAGYYDGSQVLGKQEGDIRFRSAARRIGSTRVFIVGGDTRSAVTYNATSNTAWGASDFLHERRGGHSMTTRGGPGERFIVAGGFNIAQQGTSVLKTVEIVDFQDPGRFGTPDGVFYRVNVQLPVPFAGHLGFEQADGTTVLAGGWGGSDGGPYIGPHSRRVVLILSDLATPPVGCTGG